MAKPTRIEPLSFTRRRVSPGSIMAPMVVLLHEVMSNGPAARAEPAPRARERISRRLQALLCDTSITTPALVSGQRAVPLEGSASLGVPERLVRACMIVNNP